MKTKVSFRPPSPMKGGRGRRESQNTDENSAPHNFSTTASPSKSNHYFFHILNFVLLATY